MADLTGTEKSKKRGRAQQKPPEPRENPKDTDRDPRKD